MRIYLEGEIYEFINTFKRQQNLELELRFGKKIDRQFITGITEKQFKQLDDFLSSTFSSKNSVTTVEIYNIGKDKIRKITDQNGNIVIERKKKIQHYDVDYLDFSLRLALSLEEYVDVKNLRNPSEKRIRYRKEFNNNYFTYVLTKIDKNSTEYYEFEIEFDIFKVNNQILLESINEILPLLVSQQNRCFSYLSLKEQDFIRYIFKKFRITESKPKSLQRRDVPFLQKDGYSVTNKLDGERFIILFNVFGIYSINNRIVDKIDEYSSQRVTMLDAEFFKDKFYVFDCMMSNSVNITRNPHLQRLEYASNICKMFDKFLIMKKFSTDLVDRTRYLLENLNKDDNDGLIYTPNTEYNSDKIYKWKFPEKMTIDFLVKLFKYGKFQKSVIEYNQYYENFLTVPSSYYSCLMPWHTEQVRQIMLHWFPTIRTFVDATANIGVDSIFFSKIYNDSQIYSYEIDPLTFGALIQNVSIYGSDNIKVFEKSCIDLLKNKNSNYDIVYIDAPWGGKEYYKTKNLNLYLQSEDDIVKDEYRNVITFSRYLFYYKITKDVVLKVPFNFNFVGLSNYFNYDRKDVFNEKNKNIPSFVLLKLLPKSLNIIEEYPEYKEEFENYLKDADSSNLYQLFCKGEENSLIPFSGNDRYPLSVSVYVDKDHELKENGVYEFGYDKKFILFRERPDKISPNFYKVARNIWNDIKNPFTESELLKLLSPKVLRKYRKYHNSIKKQLILEYCNEKTVLDLGSGRGGDIDKYRDSNIEFLYAVEPDKENYDEFLRRLNESSLSSKTRLIVGKAQDTNKILESIGNEYEIDVISSFFSLSFFFFRDNNKKFKDLDELINTIDKNLKYGGYFIGTTIDGEKTKDLLDSFEKFDFDGGYMKYVDKDEKIVEIVMSETIVRTQIESLVNFELLCKKLRDKNIFLEKTEFFKENDELTETENILNSLYRTFVFRRESCQDIILKEIDKILKKSKNTFFNRLSLIDSKKCIEIFLKLCISPDDLSKYESRTGFSYPISINFPKIRDINLRAKVNKPGYNYNLMREFFYGYNYINKIGIPNFIKTYSLIHINEDKKMLITENVINSVTLRYFIEKDLVLYSQDLQYKIIISIISQIYLSFLVLSKKGLYHNDITPTNILIQRNNDIKNILYDKNIKVEIIEGLIVRIIDYEVMQKKDNINNCYKTVRGNYIIQKDFVLKDLLFFNKNPYSILKWIENVKPSEFLKSYSYIYDFFLSNSGYQNYISDIVKML